MASAKRPSLNARTPDWSGPRAPSRSGVDRPPEASSFSSRGLRAAAGVQAERASSARRAIGARAGILARGYRLHAATSTILVISGGAFARAGGPTVPKPRLTYSVVWPTW